MYFTSGTTGEPKMVAHDFTYPLGHIATGVFWHNLHKDSLHLTIADTGWGKAVWGKLYTIFRFLIHEDLTKFDLSHLQYCTIAGEALNPAVLETDRHQADGRLRTDGDHPDRGHHALDGTQTRQQGPAQPAI